ncbi:hypothetical protein M0804_006419 [Polistes exclamans]|nr:hypothetical protein M0804_006419 [Polistes exclamans]
METKAAVKYAKENPETKQDKQQCKICEKKGRTNRFHPENVCWFKENESNNNETNQNKSINTAEIEAELSDTEQKKLIIPPIIKVEVLLPYNVETIRIHDSGSNISIINLKLLRLKKK